MLQSYMDISATHAYFDDDRAEAVASGISEREATLGVVQDLGNLVQIAISALNIISRNPELSTGLPLEPFVASAGAALRRASVLVHQTLRLDHDGHTTSEPVDICACLMEIEALVRTTWKRGIALELYASQALPVITCNRAELQSALMNLLLNARDAMPSGGVISLIATAICGDGAAPEIELRVSDNGLGMTEDVLRCARDPFFTTKVSGLGGLGLPMVNRFAQEAGGYFELESEPGRGTVATLRLPIVR